MIGNSVYLTRNLNITARCLNERCWWIIWARLSWISNIGLRWNRNLNGGDLKVLIISWSLDTHYQCLIKVYMISSLNSNSGLLLVRRRGGNVKLLNFFVLMISIEGWILSYSWPRWNVDRLLNVLTVFIHNNRGSRVLRDAIHYLTWSFQTRKKRCRGEIYGHHLIASQNWFHLRFNLKENGILETRCALFASFSKNIFSSKYSEKSHLVFSFHLHSMDIFSHRFTTMFLLTYFRAHFSFNIFFACRFQEAHGKTTFFNSVCLRKKRKRRQKEENEKKEISHTSSSFLEADFQFFFQTSRKTRVYKNIHMEAHTKSGQYFFRMIRKTLEMFFFNYPFLSMRPWSEIIILMVRDASKLSCDQ